MFIIFFQCIPRNIPKCCQIRWYFLLVWDAFRCWRRQIRLTLSLSYPFSSFCFLESRLLRIPRLVYASQKVELGNVQIFAYSIAHFESFRRRCLLVVSVCLLAGTPCWRRFPSPFPLTYFSPERFSLPFPFLCILHVCPTCHSQWAECWMVNALDGRLACSCFSMFLARQSVKLRIELTFSCTDCQQLLRIAFVGFEFASDFYPLFVWVLES